MHTLMSKSTSLETSSSDCYQPHADSVSGHGNDMLKWGQFEDFVQHVALQSNQEGSVDCLLNEDDGMNVWSQQSLKMLEETKMNGASTTTETKKLNSSEC